jgi:hypothetical protein
MSEEEGTHVMYGLSQGGLCAAWYGIVMFGWWLLASGPRMEMTSIRHV